MAREEGENRYICAYIVSHNEIPASDLRDFISEELPQYMVPSYFVHMDEFPLTQNGKVNRKALPEPQKTGNLEVLPPRDGLETKLVEIWSEVLGLEPTEIGIDRNFFELGGHSLKATVMIVMIYKELNVKLSLADVFGIPDIKGLAQLARAAAKENFIAVEPAEEREYYALSAAQRRMYILQQMELTGTVYNMPESFELKEEPDKDRLTETFLRLINRHETFRTSFKMIDGQSVQQIHPQVPFEIEYYEMDDQEDGDAGVQAVLDRFVRYFDLSRPPLLRVGLLSTVTKRYLLMLDMHHIISDGVSHGILSKDFMDLYDNISLSPLRIQYKDYAQWQNSEGEQKVIKEQEGFWLDLFQNEIPVLNLPTDFVRPAVKTFRGNTETFRLGRDETESLKRLALEEGTTLYMVLMAGFNILLSKLGNQDDIVLGTPVAGRRHADLKQIIGMFVNTLVLRNFPETQKTFKEFLAEVKLKTLEAFENQEYPFEILVEQVWNNRDASRNPMFDVMFVLQNIDLTINKQVDNASYDDNDEEGTEAGLYRMENRISKFDISWVGVETDDGLDFFVQYTEALFKQETIRRFFDYYKNILSSMTADSEIRLAKIGILPEEEKKRLLVDFNDTAIEYPDGQTLYQLFEEQVERTPDHVAVTGTLERAASSDGNVQLTYSCLNRKAGGLTRLLREKGVRTGSIVALLLGRSVEMMVGIWGILKAGGAYLPLETGYPEERIRYMLSDTGAGLAVTDSTFEKNAGLSRDMDILHIDGGPEQGAVPDNREDPGARADGLAYIIYTSGSTGRPKGTLTRNFNVTRVVKNTNYIDLTEKDRILQLSNYAFDGSVFDIYGALLNGGVLAMMKEEDVGSTRALADTIIREAISAFFVTTALFNALVDLEIEALAGVRKILFGGERVSVEHSRKAVEFLGTEKIIHVYGPTESTVFATYYPLQRIDERRGTVPIGYPLANTTVYILDKAGELAPTGVQGELYIGGAGIAGGYLNNADLTSQRFVANPFVPGERLYRSGDVARRLEDGSIEFIGRIDHQVKLRGFRVELGEIEYRLLQHPEVRETVLTVQEEASDRYICAYIVSDTEIPESGLRDFILLELPQYMVPAYFVHMDQLPLTRNGKVDRKALPEPRKSVHPEVLPPRDELETRLVKIWSQVLELETTQISIDHNFFELGGHSLKATVMIGLVYKELNVKLSLADAFNIPHLKGLAQLIRTSVKESFISIQPTETKEYYLLSAAQKRMYILQQMDLAGIVYNMPESFELMEEPDRERLEDTFRQLIRRHESFRTSFKMIDGQAVQVIHPDVPFEISYYHIDEESKESVEGILNRFVKYFDLSRPPLLRVGLVRTPENRYLMIVDMHHIISDGVSHGILSRDFKTLYEGGDLPPLRIQYKDYAQWQNSEGEQAVIKKQENYWLNLFESKPPMLEIAVDFARPAVQSFQGDSVSFDIGMDDSNALKTLVLQEGTTLYMVLLAAYYILLAGLSRQEDIVVGTPVAGRRHADLDQIVGMFVNTLALRNVINGEKTFTGFLTDITARTIDAFENQDYPLEILVEKIWTDRDTDRNPLFDTMFTLQNIDLNRETTDTPGGIHDDYRDGQDTETDFYTIENRVVKHDLSLTGEETDDGLSFGFNYCVALFRKETVERFSVYYKNILSAIASAPNRQLVEIDMIPEEEKRRILVEFNDTDVEYPDHSSIHRLFEEQVERTPDQIAILGLETGSVTYRELNETANRTAVLLNQKGVTPNTIVAVMIDNQVELASVLFGILKAGGAYLPIDRNYPVGRIQFMLQDSATKLLISTDTMVENLKWGEEQETIILDPSEFPVFPTSQPQKVSISTPTNAAYVIYTSGSTGKPKGVIVEHRSAVNTLYYRQEMIKMNSRTTFLQLLSYCFDAFVISFFTPLIAGARCILFGEEEKKDIHLIRSVIVNEKVTHFVSVPPLYHSIIDSLTNDEAASLRLVALGGDRLPHQSIEITRRKNEHLEILYEYGVTEATVVSLCHRHQEKDDVIKIGVPTGNTRVYVLNQYLRLQPLGVAGELCIAGVVLARGYLNNPELTSEKFIPDTFGSRKHQLLYRTGDLARWLSDGNIEFLGRIDQQVKLRGYRVELGEIENHLSKFPGIKEAVVLVRNRGGSDQILCAYIVFHEREMADQADSVEAQLKKYLVHFLPEYMVPGYFMFIERVPVTPNGKVDRDALPTPKIKADENYLAPRNETERKLVDIWADVLELEPDIIGTNDNFFQLGGHSLKATVMVSAVHKLLDVRLPLVEVFKTPHIKGLARYIDTAVREAYVSIETPEKKEFYVVSAAQRRMYILQQLDLKSTVYNMPEVFRWEEEPDREKLTHTFKQLIQRHESLRTSFYMAGEEPVQQVHEEVDFVLEYFDEETGDNLLEFSRPFDLSRAPLVRGAVARSEDDKYMLMVDMHHIISDGISHRVLFNDFAALYYGRQLPQLHIQYKDYAQWQNSERERENIKHQQQHWLKEFSGELPVLEIPTDFIRPQVQDFSGDIIGFHLELEDTNRLKQLALREGATPYMALLAVYNILLSRLSGQEDIIIGTPTAGRRHADLQHIIGMFVNTLALRNTPTASQSFSQFLHQLKLRTLAAFENQEYPFEDLVEEVWSNRDAGRNPLFDVMFVLQNIGLDAADTADSIAEEDRETENRQSEDDSFRYENQISKFDITWMASEKMGKLYFSVQYCTALFKRETVERMAAYFKRIAIAVISDPGLLISEIRIISEEEKKQLLVDFNDTAVEFPSEKTIPELFLDQMEHIPHACALATPAPADADYIGDGYLQVTYRRLNEQSDQLAGLLREAGVQSGTIVALMVERSARMIVGLMGILKAGGAYLPINAHYPRQRIRFMLADSGAHVLVSTVGLAEEIETLISSEDGARIKPATIFIDAPASAEPPTSKPLTIPTSNSAGLAYVLYTSGTTGRPKGVMVEHHSVVRLIKGNTYLRLREQDRILQTGALEFDASTFEIWGALLNGGQLIVPAKEQILSAQKLKEAIVKCRVTVMWMTASLFNQMVETDIDIFSGPRALLVGGEALSPSHINRLRSALPRLTVINGYGPTENTTFSTTYEIRTDYKQSIPIGTPISNSTVYITDKSGNIQPLGVVGELCTGGHGVSRGYLNQPELTAQKFPENPFVSGDRIYKTSDLARWLPDGSIEFFGRMDNQVKIRGFRIELGEIEYRLLENDNIKSAVVTVKKDEAGDPYLCAYVVPVNQLDIPALMEYLAVSLPDYMVPSSFVSLLELPLTPNGKVDRRALPEPSEVENRKKYTPPRNDAEKQLALVWAEVLGLERETISIDDSFFRRGGHSLKATVMISKMEQKFNLKLPLVEVFRTPTIRMLAQYITGESTPGSAVEDEQIVLLKSGVHGSRNLFLVHEGSGDVGSYLTFCDKLDLQINCWGIKASPPQHDAPLNLAVNQVVGPYIDKIKQIQPHGPYYIAGWSVGGTIAFEIARQLEKENRKVAFLGLIDSTPPSKVKRIKNRKFTLKSELKLSKMLLIDHADIHKELKKVNKIEELWPRMMEHLEKKEGF